MIVAVTGGTGFIGRHLIARHVERGDRVRYLTRRDPSVRLPGAEVFIGDLTASAERLKPFLAGADVVYHCAAELRDDGRMQAVNTDGTITLLAAAYNEVGRWVQLSSTGVYGNPRHQTIDETSTLAPVNAYERSKAAADQAVEAAVQDRGLNAVLVRPSNVYGNDMPNQSLFQLIVAIDKGWFGLIGKPGAVANYIHVDNIVAALFLCGTAKLPGNGRSYIVSDHCTMERFVDLITEALDKPPVRRRLPEGALRAAADVLQRWPGWPLTTSRIDALTNRTVYLSTRIETELGYKPALSIDDGIGALVRHWRARTARE